MKNLIPVKSLIFFIPLNSLSPPSSIDWPRIENSYLLVDSFIHSISRIFLIFLTNKSSLLYNHFSVNFMKNIKKSVKNISNMLIIAKKFYWIEVSLTMSYDLEDFMIKKLITS